MERTSSRTLIYALGGLLIVGIVLYGMLSKKHETPAAARPASASTQQQATPPLPPPPPQPPPGSGEFAG